MSSSGNVTAVLGRGLAPTLGRKGTASDVTLYNYKMNDVVLAFVEPSSYPEKIQSLVSSLNMADQVLFKIEELNVYFAEALVTLDAMNIPSGFLILGKNIPAENLKRFLAGSVLSSYPVVDEQVVALRENLASLKPKSEGPAIVQVDHSFSVKGVGTVALGVVKSGVIKKYDKVFLYPEKKSAVIKSIQVNDADVSEASAGVRVGLAIKDLKPEDVTRGTIVSTSDSIAVRDTLELDAKLSAFSPRSLKEGDVFTINSSLNYVPAKVMKGAIAPGAGGKVEIKLEKPIPVLPGRAVFLDPGMKMPRVFGFGRL